MPIPFSKIAAITPGVFVSGGAALALSGLLLTNSNRFPTGAASLYYSPEAVAAVAGDSTEATLATKYFAGPLRALSLPAQLYIARVPVTDCAGWVRCGKLSLTLAQLKALPAFVLTVTVGGVAKTSASIDLSGATSYSNAASLMTAAFTSPGFTIVWDSITQAFELVTSAVGAAATVTAFSGTGAASIKGRLEDGAILSQGADAATPAEIAAAQVLARRGWAGLTHSYTLDAEEQQGLADWVGSTGGGYYAIVWDASAAKVADNPAGLGKYCADNSINGCLPIAGDASIAVSALSQPASLNFDATEGRRDLFGSSFSGLSPYTEDGTDFDIIAANGYCTYGRWGGRNPDNDTNYFAWGDISGAWQTFSCYCNQIVINDDLQVALSSYITANSAQLPASSAGLTALTAVSSAVASKHLNFGSIRRGAPLSEAEITAIDASFGAGTARTVTTAGWAIKFDPITPAVRAAKRVTGKFIYWDGANIRRIGLNSTTVI